MHRLRLLQPVWALANHKTLYLSLMLRSDCNEKLCNQTFLLLYQQQLLLPLLLCICFSIYFSCFCSKYFISLTHVTFSRCSRLGGLPLYSRIRICLTMGLCVDKVYQNTGYLKRQVRIQMHNFEYLICSKRNLPIFILNWRGYSQG